MCKMVAEGSLGGMIIMPYVTPSGCFLTLFFFLLKEAAQLTPTSILWLNRKPTTAEYFSIVDCTTYGLSSKKQ